MPWNEFREWHVLELVAPGEFKVRGYHDDATSYKLIYVTHSLYDKNGGDLVPGDMTVFYSNHGDYEDWEYLGSFDGHPIISYERYYHSDQGPTDLLLLTSEHYEIGTIFTMNIETLSLCFYAGTLIGCPGSERPVEDLAIGDVVSTADGGTRRVKWIGRQTVMPRFADPLQSFPIRIRANALSDGVPSRDLCVSPDHAVLVDGSLVQAGALVDGVAIERMTDLPERFVYYHIEVEDHALILAENTPAETFVDNVTRRRFDNWREYEELYGEEALNIPELEMPRVRSSRQLPRPIATRLAARARRVLEGKLRGAVSR